MKIAFADPIACDYTIETPYQQPLGGSQSALCYLAEELASQGHEVFLLNNSKTPRISRGVVCLPLPLTNQEKNISIGCSPAPRSPIKHN